MTSLGCCLPLILGVGGWRQRLFRVSGTFVVTSRNFSGSGSSNNSDRRSFTRPDPILECSGCDCGGSDRPSELTVAARGRYDWGASTSSDYGRLRLLASHKSTVGNIASGSGVGNNRRSISTLSCRGGPLLSQRGRRVVNHEKLYGHNELQKLLAAGEGQGIEEKLHDVKTASGTVITVPVHLEKRLEKWKAKQNTKAAIRQRIIDNSRIGGRKANILVHCKKKEYNHYLGQSYPAAAGEKILASQGWRHRKSAGDFFTIFPGFQRDSPFFMTGTETATFKDLGIKEELCENLKLLGIEQPTHIQVFGIPLVMNEKRLLVAAETGCGKTLAYLLPLINQILSDRRLRVRTRPGHPSSIILVPSRELADQIYEVALKLTYNLDVRVKLLQGGSLQSKIKNPPNTEVDLLVATTNAIKVLTSTGTYGLGKVHHVVLDEADTLLDDSFFPELVGPFLNRIPWNEIQRDIQLTLVSATMPKDLKESLGQIMKIDDFVNCTTPGIHCILPHVPQKFLRLRKSQKPTKIIELIKQDMENKIPIIIFCNRSKTCDWLASYLNDEGYDCASVHGRMPLGYRRGRVEAFQNGEINILVATDLASRGIDTVRTQHIINYEFPLYVADYIHRCGRTGRVGSEKKCQVTNLISRLGEVETVKQIEYCARKEKALPGVDANIKRLYGQHYGSFVEIEPINDDEEEIEPINEDEEGVNEKNTRGFDEEQKAEQESSH